MNTIIKTDGYAWEAFCEEFLKRFFPLLFPKVVEMSVEDGTRITITVNISASAVGIPHAGITIGNVMFLAFNLLDSFETDLLCELSFDVILPSARIKPFDIPLLALARLFPEDK